MPPRPTIGTIGWTDLTVPDADRVRDFYRSVVGWTAEGHDMGDYQDWVMKDADGAAVAGVCHAKGPNASLPPVWLVYVNVDDLEASLAQVEEQGGRIVAPLRSMGGHGRMAVVADPAGAVLALFEPAAD